MPAPISGRSAASLSPAGPRATGPARFAPAGRVVSGVKEASDVVALPGGRLLVVSDTSAKVGLVGADGKVSQLKLPGLGGKASQFEGVAYDPRKKRLLLSREENRELWRYAWDPAKADAPALEKKVDVKHLHGPQNKGLEGLAYLPGDASPTGRPQLLAAREGNPRQLVMFDDSGKGGHTALTLDAKLKDVCADFSAVSVDPLSGHVFLSSDESSTVAELELSRQGSEVRARLVQSFPLKGADGKPLARIEGLAFNAKGDLFVLTENDGALHALARQ